MDVSVQLVEHCKTMIERLMFPVPLPNMVLGSAYFMLMIMLDTFIGYSTTYVTGHVLHTMQQQLEHGKTWMLSQWIDDALTACQERRPDLCKVFQRTKDFMDSMEHRLPADPILNATTAAALAKQVTSFACNNRETVNVCFELYNKHNYFNSINLQYC